jgi:type VI secretion system secreted protein Hcp
MASDFLLEIEGIKGESHIEGHKEWIDVLAYSWGMSQAGIGHSGGGSGAGKVSVQDMSVTKFTDASSAALMLACCTGKHIPKATLVARKAGDKPLTYVKITLTDVLVSSYQSGGSGGSDERQTENIALNFTKFKFEYMKQDEKGAGKPAGEAHFDIKKNLKI